MVGNPFHRHAERGPAPHSFMRHQWRVLEDKDRWVWEYCVYCKVRAWHYGMVLMLSDAPSDFFIDDMNGNRVPCPDTCEGVMGLLVMDT